MEDPTNTGTLLISSLPHQCLAGIDLLSFNPGPNFRGVKLLQPGFHFVFTSLTDSLSIRNGLWLRIREPPYSEPEIYLASYDKQQEHLVPETNEQENMRVRANLGALWKEGLLSYRQRSKNGSGRGKEDDFEERGDWPQMTAHITDALLDRVIGLRSQGQWGWSLTSASSAKQDIEIIPGLSRDRDIEEAESELAFLPVDLKQTWREGATGRERTEAARDRTWALKEAQKDCSPADPMEILGEMEFCYVMMLCLNNYSCLQQWKRILGLLFTCKTAVTEQSDLFIELLQLLKLQLEHIQDVEGGLLDLSEEGGALLRGLLRKFRKGLDEISGKEKADVIDELDELEAFMKSEFGWELDNSFVHRGMLELEDGEQVEMDVSGYDEDDEDGEFAPAVVDLSSEQMKALSPDGDYVNGKENKLAQMMEKNPDHEDEEEDDRDLEDMDDRF